MHVKKVDKNLLLRSRENSSLSFSGNNLRTRGGSSCQGHNVLFTFMWSLSLRYHRGAYPNGGRIWRKITNHWY